MEAAKDSPSNADADLTASAAAKKGKEAEEVYTLWTLPEEMYTYTYQPAVIPNSPKVHLSPVATGDAPARRIGLVLWKGVLLACTPRETSQVTFEYSAPKTSVGPPTKGQVSPSTQRHAVTRQPHAHSDQTHPPLSRTPTPATLPLRCAISASPPPPPRSIMAS